MIVIQTCESKFILILHNNEACTSQTEFEAFAIRTSNQWTVWGVIHFDRFSHQSLNDR